MKGHKILNTRKRVVVALVHTVVFLGVAILGFFFAVEPLRAESRPAAWIMAGVYVIVSAVLLWLTAIAGAPLERLYFACVTTSASFGLLRQVLGDQSMHAAVYVRVAMLGCAVIAGTWMLREERVPVSVASDS